MKVLIVDDEMVVRVGIKSIIDWNQNSFELVGEAANGVTALRMIERNPPDVVLTDIKMPEMDGLELIRRIKEAGYPTKIIVLSSYNDFDLVKQAMKLGASDYLLKMKMTKDSLEETLRQTLKQISSEHELAGLEALRDPLSKNLLFLRQNLLRDILIHGEEQENMFNGLKNVLNIRLYAHCMCCMCVKTLQPGPGVKANPSGILNSSMISIIEEIINDRFTGHCIDMQDGELCVILSPREEDGEIRTDHLAEQAEILCEMLRKYLSVNVAIGIGTIAGCAGEIRESYACAKAALFLSELDGGKGPAIFKKFARFPCIADFISCAGDSHIMRSLRDALSRIAASSELSEMLHMLMAISETAPKGSQPGYEDFPFAVQIYIAILRYFRSYGIDLALVLPKSRRTPEQICGISSNREAREWVECMLNDLALYFDMSGNGNYPHAVRVAVQYIKKNYYKDIPIKEIADLVNLSPSYFGNIFSQYVGTSLVHYITRIRIKNAQELLRETSYRIYEISRMVGFTNSYYFNRIFKKVTGMTPLEFRNSGGVKNAGAP
jgi:two-component system response regulator YesN